MGFSSILDISSFFIGMIINLIFVALMCYYFKRKYDYLEMAQTEQAKILYQMIHKGTPSPVPEPVDYSRDPLIQHYSDNDSDSDSDEESEVIVQSTGRVIGQESGKGEESGQNLVEEVDFVHDLAEDLCQDVPTKSAPLQEVIELDIELSEVKHIDLGIEPEESKEVLDITVNLSEESNYSKMSMKQLKEILSSKGIRAKNNIKKDELIELISKEATVAA